MVLTAALYAMGNKTLEATISSATACRDVNSIETSERCMFVLEEESCQDALGYVNYNQLMYCLLGPEYTTYTVGISVIWLLMLFVALGVTSSDFLTPALFVISKTLHMSQNVAGVTLLAFGNGSPDIFSSLAGIRQGSYELVIGGLIGGGVFVTTVVAGSIFLTQPFKLAARPFLRDSIFYLSAGYWAFCLFYYGEIRLYHAIGFISLYCVYIVVVITSGVFYQKAMNKNSNKEKNMTRSDPEKKEECKTDNRLKVKFEGLEKRVIYKENVFDDPEKTYVVPLAFRYLDVEDNSDRESMSSTQTTETVEQERNVYYINLGLDTREEEVNVDTLSVVVDVHDPSTSHMNLHEVEEKCEEVTSKDLPVWKDFLDKIFSVNLDDWTQQRLWVRAIDILKIPVFFLLAITTPVVDVKRKRSNWCRPLNIMHCVTGPVFLTIVLGYTTTLIAGVVPVVAIVALLGTILGTVVFFTSNNKQPPSYQWMFSYAGFFSGVTWIYVISMEIVCLLQAVGIVFNISDAILGLTVLAWGNCLLDFLANLNIARKGFPRMGISACFGTPFLTLLLGVGIPSVIHLLSGEESVMKLEYTTLITVLFSGLAWSLASSMITMTILNFHVKKFYGIYLMVVYISFLVFAILVESNFI